MVVAAGSLAASEEPSRSDSTGMASTSITAVAAAASWAGWRWMNPASRAHQLDAPSRAGPSAASRRRSRRDSTRIPRKPSSAGSKVTAAATVNSTVIAAAMPRPET